MWVSQSSETCLLSLCPDSSPPCRRSPNTPGGGAAPCEALHLALQKSSLAGEGSRWAGGQPASLPVSEAPVGVRGDRKVLHLKLPQIGRGGLAGRQGGPVGPETPASRPPAFAYLRPHCRSWGPQETGATGISVWGMMEWGGALAVALREPRRLSRRGTEQGSEAGAGVLWGRGPS